MTNLPSVTELSYFLELSKRLNVTRASERLGISQPTLSMAMKRLEQGLGFDLFLRDKNGVRLTREGARLAKEGQVLISNWQQVFSDVLTESADARGLVRLGCHASVARYALPKVLQKVLLQNPKMEFKLEHDLSRKILDRVLSGDLDCALVMNPTPQPDLVTKKILQDSVCFFEVASNLNPDVLIYDPDLQQSQTLLKKVQHRKFKRKVECSNLEVIARLTQSGCGVGILPARVAQLLTEPPLNTIRQSPAVVDQLYFVYRVSDRKTRRIQVLKEALDGLA